MAYYKVSATLEEVSPPDGQNVGETVEKAEFILWTRGKYPAIQPSEDAPERKFLDFRVSAKAKASVSILSVVPSKFFELTFITRFGSSMRFLLRLYKACRSRVL